MDPNQSQISRKTEQQQQQQQQQQHQHQHQQQQQHQQAAQEEDAMRLAVQPKIMAKEDEDAMQQLWRRQVNQLRQQVISLEDAAVVLKAEKLAGYTAAAEAAASAAASIREARETGSGKTWASVDVVRAKLKEVLQQRDEARLERDAMTTERDEMRQQHDTHCSGGRIEGIVAMRDYWTGDTDHFGWELYDIGILGEVPGVKCFIKKDPVSNYRYKMCTDERVFDNEGDLISEINRHGRDSDEEGAASDGDGAAFGDVDEAPSPLRSSGISSDTDMDTDSDFESCESDEGVSRQSLLDELMQEAAVLSPAASPVASPADSPAAGQSEAKVRGRDTAESLRREFTITPGLKKPARCPKIYRNEAEVDEDEGDEETTSSSLKKLEEARLKLHYEETWDDGAENPQRTMDELFEQLLEELGAMKKDFKAAMTHEQRAAMFATTRHGLARLVEALPTELPTSSRSQSQGMFGESNLKINTLKGVLFLSCNEKEWLELIAYMLGRGCGVFRGGRPPKPIVDLKDKHDGGIASDKLNFMTNWVVMTARLFAGTCVPQDLPDGQFNSAVRYGINESMASCPSTNKLAIIDDILYEKYRAAIRKIVRVMQTDAAAHQWSDSGFQAFRSLCNKDPVVGNIFGPSRQFISLRDEARLERARHRRRLDLARTTTEAGREVGLETPLTDGRHSLLAFLFGKLPGPDHSASGQFFESFVRTNKAIRPTNTVCFRNVKAAGFEHCLAEIAYVVRCDTADIDLDATNRQWFGTTDDASAYRRIGETLDNPFIPATDSLGRSVDRCVSIVFTTPEAAAQAVKAVSSWVVSMSASLVHDWDFLTGADKAGGLIKRRPLTISIIKPDHPDMFASSRTSLVNALWEGSDNTEDLWHHMSQLHSGVRQLEGGLVIIDDLPGCGGMCLRLHFLGIGDGMERRYSNKQQGASSSTPLDDSDMSSLQAKMTMPTAQLHQKETVVSTGEITSLGKDIAPHIAGLLGAVLGATGRLSSAVKNTDVRIVMDRLRRKCADNAAADGAGDSSDSDWEDDRNRTQVVWANDLIEMAMSGKEARKHGNFYLRDFFTHIAARVNGTAYKGKKQPKVDVKNDLQAAFFVTDCLADYKAALSKTVIESVEIASNACAEVLKDAIEDFVPAFNLLSPKARDILGGTVSWSRGEDQYQFRLSGVLDDIDTLLKAHSGDAVDDDTSDDTRTGGMCTALSTMHTAAGRKLMPSHDKSPPRYTRVSKKLFQSFVSCIGGFTGAPFFRKSLQGLLHGIIRSQEKSLKLGSYYTIAVTGSVRETIEQAEAAGVHLRVVQHAQYKAPHLNATIMGGSNGNTLAKLATHTDVLLSNLSAAVVGEELENVVELIKATYRFPYLIYYVCCDPEPMLSLKMGSMKEVTDLLRRLAFQVRMAAAALYAEKLNHVPSWVMMTITIIEAMEGEDWRLVSKGFESIVEAAVKDAKRAKTSSLLSKSRSTIEQTLDAMWSTPFFLDEEDGGLDAVKEAAHLYRLARREKTHALFERCLPGLTKLEGSYDKCVATDLLRLIRDHRDDPPAVGPAERLIQLSDLPLSNDAVVQYFWKDGPSTKTKYDETWLTARYKYGADKNKKYDELHFLVDGEMMRIDPPVAVGNESLRWPPKESDIRWPRKAAGLLIKAIIGKAYEFTQPLKDYQHISATDLVGLETKAKEILQRLTCTESTVYSKCWSLQQYIMNNPATSYRMAGIDMHALCGLRRDADGEEEDDDASDDEEEKDNSGESDDEEEEEYQTQMMEEQLQKRFPYKHVLASAVLRAAIADTYHGDRAAEQTVSLKVSTSSNQQHQHQHQHQQQQQQKKKNVKKKNVKKNNVDKYLVKVPRDIGAEGKYAAAFWPGDGEENYKSYKIGQVDSISFSGNDQTFNVTELTPSIGRKRDDSHWLDESSGKLKVLHASTATVNVSHHNVIGFLECKLTTLPYIQEWKVWHKGGLTQRRVKTAIVKHIERRGTPPPENDSEDDDEDDDEYDCVEDDQVDARAVFDSTTETYEGIRKERQKRDQRQQQQRFNARAEPAVKEVIDRLIARLIAEQNPNKTKDRWAKQQPAVQGAAESWMKNSYVDRGKRRKKGISDSDGWEYDDESATGGPAGRPRRAAAKAATAAAAAVAAAATEKQQLAAGSHGAAKKRKTSAAAALQTTGGYHTVPYSSDVRQTFYFCRKPADRNSDEFDFNSFARDVTEFTPNLQERILFALPTSNKGRYRFTGTKGFVALQKYGNSQLQLVDGYKEYSKLVELLPSYAECFSAPDQRSSHHNNDYSVFSQLSTLLPSEVDGIEFPMQKRTPTLRNDNFGPEIVVFARAAAKLHFSSVKFGQEVWTIDNEGDWNRNMAPGQKRKARSKPALPSTRDGIMNGGNLCYMIAACQAVLRLVDVTALEGDGLALKPLAEHVQQRSQPSGPFDCSELVCTKTIKTFLKDRGDHSEGGYDAHEFLVLLLEMVGTTQFAVQIRERYCCQSVRCQTARIERYGARRAVHTCLSLPMRNDTPTTVAALLTEYIKFSTTVSTRCCLGLSHDEQESCGEQVSLHELTQSVDKTPETLCVQLQRLPVVGAPRLVTQVTVERQMIFGGVSYILHSVILHRKFGIGHYVTVVDTGAGDDAWKECDDSCTKYVNIDDYLSTVRNKSDVYMAVYTIMNMTSCKVGNLARLDIQHAQAAWCCDSELNPLTNEVGSKTFAAKDKGQVLTVQDVQCLHDSEWLNDACANVWLRDMQQTAAGATIVVSTQFYTRYTGTTSAEYDYSGVKKWTKYGSTGKVKENEVLDHKIIVPLHQGNHWAAIMVSVVDRTIWYFDSMYCLGKEAVYIKTMQRWVNDVRTATKLPIFDYLDWDCRAYQVPQQSNGSDCGFFMGCFVRYLCLEADIQVCGTNMLSCVDQTEMSTVRLIAAHEILKGSS